MASKTPQQIDLKIPYREEISRWFVFRFLWVFPLVFVLWVWMVWLCIVMFLQFWYMLFMGKRQKWLYDHFVMFFRYNMRWNAYFNWIVDKRPLVFDFESKEK